MPSGSAFTYGLINSSLSDLTDMRGMGTVMELIRHGVGSSTMNNFRVIDRETRFLLPPSVDEWLPETHLARFVVEVIERLDLSTMVGSYRGSGSASYHPALLLGLLV